MDRKGLRSDLTLFSRTDPGPGRVGGRSQHWNPFGGDVRSKELGYLARSPLVVPERDESREGLEVATPDVVLRAILVFFSRDVRSSSKISLP